MNSGIFENSGVQLTPVGTVRRNEVSPDKPKPHIARQTTARAFSHHGGLIETEESIRLCPVTLGTEAILIFAEDLDHGAAASVAHAGAVKAGVSGGKARGRA
jgi:hypothetical protein